SHGVHRGRKARTSPSTTTVHMKTAPSAAAARCPTAAIPAAMVAAIDATTPIRRDVVVTSVHHAPVTPSVDPRNHAARARFAARNATIESTTNMTWNATTTKRHDHKHDDEDAQTYHNQTRRVPADSTRLPREDRADRPRLPGHGHQGCPE